MAFDDDCDFSVQEVNAESREMMRRALEEAEEEMRKKTQLIKQIRAMESIPIVRYSMRTEIANTVCVLRAVIILANVQTGIMFSKN